MLLLIDHLSVESERKWATNAIAESSYPAVPGVHLHAKLPTILSRHCGFRGLRPGIPIEHDHAFRSKAATCSDEGGRGLVAGMRNWVRFSWLRQEWRAAQ
jgi:hypothetical protein